MTHRPVQPLSEIAVKPTGHFIWENAADEYADVVTAWWAGGFKTCFDRSTSVAGGS